MFFAIDAAQKLGAQGESTQVGLRDEHGHSDRNGATATILIRLRVYAELGPLGPSNLWERSGP
jgi:hypothetical protein